MPDRTESRFPFSEYPKGWFQVAYSRDVDSSEIIPLHYFGARLICYRGGPQLARGESVITEFRERAEQFYERASAEEPTLAS